MVRFVSQPGSFCIDAPTAAKVDAVGGMPAEPRRHHSDHLQVEPAQGQALAHGLFVSPERAPPE